jgi:Xaa-Pro aminopeptidase
MEENGLMRKASKAGLDTSEPWRSRRTALADVLGEKKVDAYFFSGISDLYYLTGFHSEGFYGLMSGRGGWLFSSALMAGQVGAHAGDCRMVVGKRLTPTLAEIREKHSFKKIGFDPDQLPYRLGKALEKVGLQPLENPLADLRIVKDEEEMAAVRRACRITARSIDYIRPRLRSGVTEKTLAREIESFFYKEGSPRIAFDLIVAMGDHTALPHHIPTDRRLARNQPVIFDIGCSISGYRSDLTRTLIYGKISPSLRRVFNIVQAAQKAGMERVRSGATGGQVDAASRGVITRAGYGRYFIHSTGHGVGIDIHEPPWIRPKSQDVLKPGMILTVEPGIYLPGRFGVRIEDTLAVTETGYEVLTKA